MFLNPQDALPLPVRPSLERYRELAEELTEASRSGDADGLATFTDRWMVFLAAGAGEGRIDGRPSIGPEGAEVHSQAALAGDVTSS